MNRYSPDRRSQYFSDYRESLLQEQETGRFTCCKSYHVVKLLEASTQQCTASKATPAQSGWWFEAGQGDVMGSKGNFCRFDLPRPSTLDPAPVEAGNKFTIT